MGRLEAIYIKRAMGGPMDTASHAAMIAGRGIVGNANQGGRRQVTLLEREVWEAVAERLGHDRAPSTRRANLLVSGIALRESREQTLAIGGVRVRILGETKPCHQMEEAFPGLEAALWPDWGGGAFGEVLDDGEIAVGDAVAWVAPDAAPVEASEAGSLAPG